MANSEHLDKLCQGPKIWNAWRDENPGIIPDLTDGMLTLSQRQFGPRNGGPINLSGADLKGAVLRYATLTQADLSGAMLNGADLTHARLDNANLVAADLTDVLLDNADFADAYLERAVLVGASLVNARNLTQEQVQLAYGDSSTLLPASLMPPQSWFPTIEDDEFGDYTEYPVPEMMGADDPYEILGVERSAKQEDIRRAYRGLVKKLHPDLNPDDKEAQDLFKKVSSAYNILSNVEKRARYDKGEIDAEGRVKPEYKARQHFRRYAFRFYAAAAMSLMLVAGLLGVIWHAVLTDNPSAGTVKIALAPPPKNTDSLFDRSGDRKPAEAARLQATPDETVPEVGKQSAAEPTSKSGKQPSINEDRLSEDAASDGNVEMAPKEKAAQGEAPASSAATAKSKPLKTTLADKAKASSMTAPMSIASLADADANISKQTQRLPQSKPEMSGNSLDAPVTPQGEAANAANNPGSPVDKTANDTAKPVTVENQSKPSPGKTAQPEGEAPRVAALAAEDGAKQSAIPESAPSNPLPDGPSDGQPVFADPIPAVVVPPDLRINKQSPALTQPQAKLPATFFFTGDNRPVDAASAFLTARAVERIMAHEGAGETASLETPAKAKSDDGVVQDFYFHSIEGRGKEPESTEFSGVPFENKPSDDARIVKQNVPMMPVPVAKGVIIATQEPEMPVMETKEAGNNMPMNKHDDVVSDILAGGL